MSQSSKDRAPSAAQLNERLDWMFVDLLTLTVGLLVMQVFILPALRSSQTKGVPPPPGKWLMVELRVKGVPKIKRPPLMKGEWSVYLRSDSNQITHGDDPAGTLNPTMQSPQYGDDGSLGFVILPRDGESYMFGAWLQTLSESRLATPAIQEALLKGMEVRVRPLGSTSREGPESSTGWTSFDSANAFHAEIPLTPELWDRPGD